MKITKALIENKKFTEAVDDNQGNQGNQNTQGDDTVTLTPEMCELLVETFFELIDVIDIDSLPEDLQHDVFTIANWFDDTEVEEAVAPVKKKIPPQEKRANHLYYMKNKTKIKQRLKKYRNSAKYKQWLKKYKRMSKMGKTATGKRQTDYM